MYKKEVSRKRVRSEKQNDGTIKEVHEDEILSEKTDEGPITVATTLTTLSNSTIHNVTMLSDKLSQVESDNNRLKDEVLSLKEEIKKRRKVEDGTTPLRATILDQQAKLFDIKMECFHEINKMTDKVKIIKKHLEIVSQTHQRMRDL